MSTFALFGAGSPVAVAVSACVRSPLTDTAVPASVAAAAVPFLSGDGPYETRLTVHFDGGVKPAQIKARVIRCQVSAIGGGGSLQYQSAIAFEGRVELPVEESALPAAPVPVPVVEEPPPAAKKGKAAAAPPPPAPAPPRVYNRW